MNLIDSAFLCLDVGTHGVRGMAHRVRNANLDKSAFFTVDSFDTVYAIKSVVDELEKQIGRHFDSAYITGNLGESMFEKSAKSTAWGGEHEISLSDVRSQISQIKTPENFLPLHIVPLRYDTPNARNILSPVGHIDRQLISVFGAIFYSHSGIDNVFQCLHSAHIQPIAFLDPQFVQNSIYRKSKQTTMFVDFGAEYSSASIWTDRGPVWHTKIKLGGQDITNAIAEKFNISVEDADRIKHAVSSLIPSQIMK